jgi:hypothetical protein
MFECVTFVGLIKHCYSYCIVGKSFMHAGNLQVFYILHKDKTGGAYSTEGDPPTPGVARARARTSCLF